MPLICIFYRHETVLIIKLYLYTHNSPAHNKVHSHATHRHLSLIALQCTLNAVARENEYYFLSANSRKHNGTFRSKKKLNYILYFKRIQRQIVTAIFLILLSQTWISFYQLETFLDRIQMQTNTWRFCAR